MTQPQNPGQPYYPQQPSAPSAPAPGQPYQQYQAPGAAGVAGAPGAAPAPGQPYPPQVTGDSFFGNLFDVSKGFVERFGKAMFIVAAVALGVDWFYDAYNLADTFEGFKVGTLLVKLLVSAPWKVTLLFLVRLFIELVRGSVRTGARA